MAYSYQVDGERRVEYVRMSGPITFPEIRDASEKIAAEPEVTAGFGELIDLRDATTDAVTTDELRSIAAARLDAATRRAFVTSDILTYGLARMFEIYRGLNRKQDEIAVFRSLADAERWLGIDPSETRAGDDARPGGQ